MNEKIKSLLTPQLKEWGGASGDNFSEELEKFAMNIINECLSVVSCCMETTDYPDDFVKSLVELEAHRLVYKTIKAEFGIK